MMEAVVIGVILMALWTLIGVMIVRVGFRTDRSADPRESGPPPAEDDVPHRAHTPPRAGRRPPH